ncbi:MAG: NAD(P)-binding protein [Bacteroidia bacterium]|nr:NAD(P)-binding protein [Bacteroidia bacterium]
MINLKIDNITIHVQDGISVLKAAETTGIKIPTMCFNESVPNHASCMVCAVKNNISGEFIPSCEMKVQEGMDIICNSQEVFEFRKDALELLLSDHVGDCEAPCRISCPAFMDIPKMNRLIAQGEFLKALQVVKEEIALPLILGYICSAPCENACRRNQIEGAVSICQLKKFVAIKDSENGKYYLPEKLFTSNNRVGIIGTGMAGLSAAYHLLRYGYSCTLFDKNESAGGKLLNISETELPKLVLETEIEILKQFGAEFKLNSLVTIDQISNDFDAIIIATGENSNVQQLEINEDAYTTNISGVFAAGSVIKPIKMAVKVVANGKAVANSVHCYLSGIALKKQKRQFNSRFGKLNESEIAEYLKESMLGNRNEPVNGKLAGFNNEVAIAEASRCLRCDCRKAESCKLRILSDKYEADQQKFKSRERKSIRKLFQHEVLVYESEKCIKCGLCVEITKRNKDIVGLSYVGRGFDIQINIPFNKSLDEAIKNSALECILNCPTGAISNYKGER